LSFCVKHSCHFRSSNHHGTPVEPDIRPPLDTVDHGIENYILAIEGSDNTPVFDESCDNAPISE